MTFAFGSSLRGVVSAYGLISGNNAAIAQEDSIYIPQIVGFDSISLADITMPKYGQKYARFEIESVNIQMDLYFGDSAEILKKGAGQYIGSSIPGYGKPILIAGHNTINRLKPIKDIEVGDVIAIQTSYGLYKYEVNEIRIAKSTDTSAYDLSQSKEILILYTCYPFGVIGYKPDRLFVYADKVSGPTIR